MVRVSRSPVGRRRPRWLRWVAAATLVTVAVTIAFFGAVAGSDRLRAALMERTGAVDTAGVVRAVALAPLNRLRAATSGVAEDRVSLHVKFKHIHKVHEQRDEARRTGLFTPSHSDLIPGSLESESHSARVRLRLAGDRIDRLDGERWPFYFLTRGDDHVFGMRSFELRPPSASAFPFAHLLLAHLAHEGIVAPQFGLIDFTLNGKNIGLMAFEEVPAAELLARHERRDGPILRFDSFPRFGEAAGTTALAPIRAERVADSKTLSRNASTAARLIQAYLHEALLASDVFDAELFGRFFAIVELWGPERALHWRNLRFYFNPLTAQLEPVAFVGDPPAKATPENGASDFAETLLADPDIAAAYQSEKERIGAEIREDALARRLHAADADWLRLLHREFPLRAAFDPDSHLAPPSGGSQARRDAGVDRPQALHRAESELPLAGPSLAETLSKHPFLRFDDERTELRVAAGRWDVIGSLVLPEDIGLFVPAGTVLRFQARHGLIARGPLRFEGRADAPIVLEGPAVRRRSQLWAGIYVVESRRPSHWAHVVVRNTGGFKQRGFELAGGVVFRKAPVTLSNCSFRGDRSDDALNVVRTRFELSDVEIIDAELDAFDADYSEGTIARGSIARVGGDGVDMGGTRATIRGTRISNVRDKAISVGERSSLTASGLTIDHVGIGITSKNGSTAEVSESEFTDVSDVALVVYMNQPEFGPGSLKAANNRILRTALPALAQTGSRLELDGRAIRPIDAAINRLHKDGLEGAP